MPSNVIPIVAVLAIFLTGRLHAQTLDDVRDAIRNSLAATKFPHFVVGLVDMSEENELSAANYEIGDEPRLDVSTLILPLSGRSSLGDGENQLYWEAYFGYLDGTADLRNLFGGTGALAGTSAKSDWYAYSALGGIGVEFPLVERVTLTPIVNFSISRVDNDTSYAGPGAAIGAAVLDGIFFNWNATFIGYGGGLRSDWNQPLGNDYDMELVVRYDFQRLVTTTSTDRAQDFTENSHRFVSRLDFTGPTGLSPFGSALRWRTKLGYRRFLSDAGDALGFDDFVEMGVGLELIGLADVPLLSQISVSGSVIRGHDIRGWSFGVGVKF